MRFMIPQTTRFSLETCHRQSTWEIVCGKLTITLLYAYTHTQKITHNQFVNLCTFFSFSFSRLSHTFSRYGILTSVLVTKCGYIAVSTYDYKNFIKISDIKNSQPDGYILRIVLYIQGARDGNILLSTSDHPNFERDFVYEFGKLSSSRLKTNFSKKKRTHQVFSFCSNLKKNLLI